MVTASSRRRAFNGSRRERKRWRHSRTSSIKKKTFPMKTLYTEEEVRRIRQRIDEYRATKRRQLLERAIKLWRRGESTRTILKLRESRERMH
jgi:hypothetical protein